MAAKNHNLFASFGSAIVNFGTTVSVAREVNELYNTPEAVFRARGTTRDATVRATMKRL